MKWINKINQKNVNTISSFVLNDKKLINNNNYLKGKKK